jgi:hypothetical protein
MAGGRPKKGLHEFQDIIESWRTEGVEKNIILQRLQDEHGTTVSMSTLTRELRAWKNRVIQRMDEELSDDLREEIIHSFHQIGSSDKAILQLLRTKGHNIQPKRFQRIRTHLGLHRRAKTTEEKQLQINECRTWLQQEFAKSGLLRDWGMSYVYDEAKEAGYLFSR